MSKITWVLGWSYHPLFLLSVVSFPLSALASAVRFLHLSSGINADFHRDNPPLVFSILSHFESMAPLLALYMKSNLSD